ncbi:hypothetical protein K438DRAFT_1775677 [Mycena galopus ATCC 62051]|nr:hypothetical protein K438DRAFT_1775677 [Mycena galopus ATCC 62051]
MSGLPDSLKIPDGPEKLLLLPTDQSTQSSLERRFGPDHVKFNVSTGDEQPILSDSIPKDAVKKIRIEPLKGLKCVPFVLCSGIRVEETTNANLVYSERFQQCFGNILDNLLQPVSGGHLPMPFYMFPSSIMPQFPAPAFIEFASLVAQHSHALVKATCKHPRAVTYLEPRLDELKLDLDQEEVKILYLVPYQVFTTVSKCPRLFQTHLQGPVLFVHAFRDWETCFDHMSTSHDGP